MAAIIRAALFDMDGLMFDTERLADRVWEQTVPRYGYAFGPDDMALLRGVSYEAGRRALAQRFGPQFPFVQIHAACTAEMRRLLARSVPKMPGLDALLAFLRAHGVAMAVASSTNRAQVEEYLDTAGVRGFFGAVLGGDMIERSKPCPDIYLAAARALGVPPEECLVLEDSYNGVRAGAAAGCETVMIPDLAPATDEMRALAACILPGLADVAGYLAGRTPR